MYWVLSEFSETVSFNVVSCSCVLLAKLVGKQLKLIQTDIISSQSQQNKHIAAKTKQLFSTF